MDLDKLRDLIQLFEAADIAEIEVEEDGSRILLKKASPIPMALPQPIAQPPAIALSMPAAAVPASQPVAAPARDQAHETPPADPPEDEGLVTVDSPMVGVFYVAPAPGDPPFARPGDMVEAGQTLCIVEAMKLMNEVTAKFACTIEKVLVENAEPVEFGQPMFAVRPTEEA